MLKDNQESIYKKKWKRTMKYNFCKPAKYNTKNKI